MKRPVIVQAHRHVGLSGIAHRKRRKMALDIAVEAIRSMDQRIGNRGDEFAMEVSRAMIRALTARMAFLTTPGRAMGVLTGATVDIAPAWERSGAKPHDAEAEALFAKQQVRA